jgi:hypothetical protein
LEVVGQNIFTREIKMDWIGPFKTKFGKIKIIVHHGSLLVTDLDGEDCKEDGDMPFLTVFGVDYSFKWGIPYDAEKGVYHDGGSDWSKHRPYMSRRDNYVSASVRGPAWNKLCGVVLDLVNSGIITDAMRLEAKVEWLERDLEGVDKDIVETQNTLDELLASRRSINLELSQTKLLTGT